MQYLVTGGTGFIGSHLVDELVRIGHSVILLSTRKHTDSRNEVTVVSGSITNSSEIQNIFHDFEIDGVFHLAAFGNAPLSFTQQNKVHEINVCGTENLLSAASKADVSKVIFSSSALVYGKTTESLISEKQPLSPLSPYAESKIDGEKLCEHYLSEYGLQSVSLRYFNTYGPRQSAEGEYAAAIPRFCKMIVNGESPVIFGSGEQKRDFVYVKDIVSANILAVQSNVSGVFNIGSGVSSSLNTIVSEIQRIAGTNIDIIYKPVRQEETSSVCADISLAKEAFNYSPQYSLRDGLEETVRFFQGRKD